MAAAATSANILLVEDSISLAELYAEELRQADLPVTHVELGKQALAAIRKSVPDVVLLDLGLPDMDGLDILRLIDEEQIPTTVIIITAQSSLDPPPLNWSAVYFSERRIKDGNETTQTRRDSLQVTAG